MSHVIVHCVILVMIHEHTQKVGKPSLSRSQS